LYRSFYDKYASGRQEYAWSSDAVDSPAEEGNSVLIATRAIRMLGEALRTGAPFFLHVAIDDPHPPYFVPPPYDTLVDPADVDLPALPAKDRQPAWQRTVHQQGRTDLAGEADLRQLIAIYYGMIAYANDQMRRIYEALRERGLLDNTWLIIGSDHGDYTGEKGMFAKTESLYECLLHVPLILVPPAGSGGLPRQGELIPGLVNTIDLFPTILGHRRCSGPRVCPGPRPGSLDAAGCEGALARLPVCPGGRLPQPSGDHLSHRHASRWPAPGPPAGRPHDGILLRTRP
jgi:arylsulfatase A-like enzyme